MTSTLDRVAPPKVEEPQPQPTPPVIPPASDSSPLSWMKSKATGVAHALVTSVWVGGFAVGAITLTVAAIFGVAVLFNNGIIQQLIPPPPVVVQPPESIKISIHGPSPSVVISGVSSVFTADVIGPAGVPEWHVFPPAAANVTTNVDGKRIDLLAATDGRFSLIATISGDGRQLASARTEVEAMAQVVQQPLPPEPPAPRPPDPIPPEPPKPVAETVTSRIMRKLAEVNSPNKSQDAKKIGNVITTTIVGRINAGAIGQQADIGSMVYQESVKVLGTSAPQWDLFLSEIALVLDNFHNQGLTPTVAYTVPVLTEIAAVLLKAQ